MANPFNTILKPLVRGFGEAASRAKPFYSGVDQAISAITQNKGTGQQMLAEILKTKGAAKELKDRPVVRAALNQPKITKEQLQKIATDNPAPQFTEKTRGESGFEAEADKRVAEMKRFRVHDIMDEMNPDSLPQSEEQWKAARLSAENVVQDEEKQIRQNVVDVLHNEGSFYPKFGEWTIPGGTNYREILFQLPTRNNAPDFLKWHADYRGGGQWQVSDDKGVNQGIVRAEQDADKQSIIKNWYNSPAGSGVRVSLNKNFQDPHYPDSNILAHARVSDRFEPNGDKALHVEEVQSAWHQKARDTRKKEIKRLIDSGVSKADANKQVPVEYGYGPRMEKTVEAYYETKSGQRIPVGFGKTKEEAEASIDVGWKNLVDIKYETFDKKVGEGVPDSPFKENWHELVMKRLLDDAVKTGYKKVYITPGAEQAKRYNLAKYISKIEYEPTEQAGRYEIVAYGKKGEVVYHEDMVNLRRIEELVGKDMARKIENDEGTLSSPNSGYRDWREFSGLELKSGGEGMLGFYDKMVPSFVNDYGAPHNMRMNLHDTQVGGNKYTVFEDSNPSGFPVDPFSVVREGGSAIASRHGTREEAEAAAAELSTQPLHSIAITPEFEKHVQDKGQRLYQAIPAGIGAGIGAEALTEEEPAPMKKGGPVSLDAMRLAVMNKKVQHKQYGGALRSGISRIRKNMISEPNPRMQIFIGSKSNLYKSGGEKTATAMETAGKSPEDIWMQTKTFKGADGKWRQEISDKDSKFLDAAAIKGKADAAKEFELSVKQKIAASKTNPDLFPKQLKQAQKELRDQAKVSKASRESEFGLESDPELSGNSLDIVLEHPTLYEAYPELRKVVVNQGGYGGNTLGQLSHAGGDIAMDIFDEGLKRDPRSTALHEAQHAVQIIEGWSPGGSSMMAFQNQKAFDILNDLRAKAKIPLPFDEYAKDGGWDNPESAKRDYDKYVKGLKTISPENDRVLQGEAAKLYYKRLAGETEARAAQDRADFNDAQLSARPPSDDYEFQIDEQIVKPPFKRAAGGVVQSDDAMRMAVMNKQLRKHHG